MSYESLNGVILWPGSWEMGHMLCLPRGSPPSPWALQPFSEAPRKGTCPSKTSGAFPLYICPTL